MVSLLPFLRTFLTDVFFFFCRRKCPLPCGVLGADLGSSSALGASFSVSVLNEAQGSDGCLLEPQTEYEVDGALVDDGKDGGLIIFVLGDFSKWKDFGDRRRCF